MTLDVSKARDTHLNNINNVFQQIQFKTLIYKQGRIDHRSSEQQIKEYLITFKTTFY